MSCIITSTAFGCAPLYAVRDTDGDIIWHPRRSAATRFTEHEAESVAADLNRYSHGTAVVSNEAEAA